MVGCWWLLVGRQNPCQSISKRIPPQFSSVLGYVIGLSCREVGQVFNCLNPVHGKLLFCGMHHYKYTYILESVALVLRILMEVVLGSCILKKEELV